MAEIVQGAGSRDRPAPRAVGVGELLWDLLPGGPRLGGAPFNVIAHLRRLGFRTAYVSAVGGDDLGRRALGELRRLGVDEGFIGVVDGPTGTVNVQLDGAGVPTFEIVSPAAYESLPGFDPAAAGAFDALVFGTLAQRFPDVRRATRELALSAAGRAALRLYDVNLRDRCWDATLVDELVELATILKLNEHEVRALTAALSIPAGSIEAFATAAAARYGLRGVCVTRGADGASLLLDGLFVEVAAVPVRVVDTVGAGDAFAAALVAGLVEGRPPRAVLERAARLASLVASREGAIPDWEPSGLGGGGEPTARTAPA